MKKILYILIIISLLFFGALNINAANLTTIYGGGPNIGTDCGGGKVPKDSETYKAGSTMTCQTHNYYNSYYEKTTSKNTHTMCDGEDRVVGKGSGDNIKCQRYDDSAPIGTLIKSISSWTKGDVIVTIDCSDAGGSGCDMYDISGWSKGGTTYSKTFISNDSGNITLKDNAGNTKIVSYSITNIDKGLPVVSATNADNSWKTQDISITLNASDSGLSGIKTLKYRFNNSDCWSGTDFVDNSLINLTTEGDHTMYLCIEDNAGNKGVVWDGQYKLDKTVPTGSLSYYDGWINSGTGILFTSEDLGSKLSYVELFRSDDNGVNYDSINRWPSIGNINSEIKNEEFVQDAVNSKTYRYKLKIVDIALNETIIESSSLLKFDTSFFTSDNITLVSPLENNLLYANNSKEFIIESTKPGSSDITYLEGYFEDPSNKDLFINYNSNNSDLIGNMDISEITEGLDYNPDGYRTFTYKITKICNESGTCLEDLDGIKEFNFNVYPNDISIGGSLISLGGLDDLNVDLANGSNYNVILNLRDVYGNKIVKTDISDVDFKLEVNHSLKLANGNTAVLLGIPNNRLVDDKIPFGNNVIDFYDQLDDNGSYKFSFGVNSPTYQNEGDVNDNFKIIGLSVDSGQGYKNLFLNIDFNFRKYPTISEEEIESEELDELIDLSPYNNRGLVSGSYGGKVLKISTGGLDYIFALPSLTTNGTGSEDLESILDNDKLVFNEYGNIPVTYDGINDNLGGFKYRKNDILLFTKLSKYNLSNLEANIIKSNIKKVYYRSILRENDSYSNFSDESLNELLRVKVNDGNQFTDNYVFEWKKVDSSCNSRDIVIGNQVWAGCNSTIGNGGMDSFGSSKCYNYLGLEIACSSLSSTNTEGDMISGKSNNIWGKLYSKENKSSACPSGWHVSTEDDWDNLLSNLGCNSSESGWKCRGMGWRDKENYLNNLVDFLGLPLSGKTTNDSLDYRGSKGYYWSGDNAKVLNWNSEYLGSEIGLDFDKYNVRCVKD